MKIRQHIPNGFTCANLICGFYACILALSGNYSGAAVAVLAAAGFDFIDGFAARWLNACSPIGKDLDSLADLVSFGVAPGMMLFDFIDRTQKSIASWDHPLCGKWFLVAALVIPVCSALRLAKFNHDTRQHSSFLGLPVPAHALFWVSLLAVPNASAPVWNGLLNPAIQPLLLHIPPIYLLAAITLLATGSSLLLVSEIPLFSLKMKSPGWKGNELRYGLLLSAAGFILCFGFLGITLTIPLYVLLSIFNKWE